MNEQLIQQSIPIQDKLIKVLHLLNNDEFQQLIDMIMKINSIQPTIVQYESSFSILKHVINSNMTSVTSQMNYQLQFSNSKMYNG